MTFNYKKMLEEFRNNYYNQRWQSWKNLTYTWELLKILEKVPALNELSGFLGLNVKTLRRKLRKVFSNKLYNDLMKDLKDKKAKMPETKFRDLVDNGGWKKSPYDREIVMPKDVAIIIEKDGTRRKRIRSPEDGICWPTGRGPHIVDVTKIPSGKVGNGIVSDPKMEWNFLSDDLKFDKRNVIDKVLSEKRDELREAESKKSKITSDRFTKMTPADFARLSKKFKRREKEIEQEQVDQASSEDEFYEEE